jgi:aspartate/methionine/tyrosine aminotransferase
VTAGLSKAYGLPGLRIGWIAGPPETIADLWRYKDYSTIGPGALSDVLARAALEPDRRARILERTRRILREHFPVVERWIRDGDGLLELVPPLAGAIAYVQYRRNMPSVDLFERLRDEKNVLVVGGHHFEMEGFLRIGFGGDRSILEEGLSRISEVLAS